MDHSFCNTLPNVCVSWIQTVQVISVTVSENSFCKETHMPLFNQEFPNTFDHKTVYLCVYMYKYLLKFCSDIVPMIKFWEILI